MQTREMTHAYQRVLSPYFHGGRDAADEGAREVRQSVSTSASVSSTSSVSMSMPMSVVPAPAPPGGRSAAVAVIVMDVTPGPEADPGDALVENVADLAHAHT